ncbi:MAG: ubiquinone/menaquinone biosynthesis methyltransferase [Acidimicrobiales bacterium]
MRRLTKTASRRSATCALPDDADKASFVKEMFDSLAPRYDLLNALMTFGLDTRWRSRAVTLLGLQPGSIVLDLASGTGDLARELSRRAFVPVAADISLGMLARSKMALASLAADAALLPFTKGCFDGAVSGFALRNFADLAAVAGELGRVLRPGGRLSVLEVSEPEQPLVRAGHSIWFRHAVPLLGALLSDANAYRYLPQSMAYLPSPKDLASLLEAAGFGEVRRQVFTGGVVQIVTATRRGGQTYRARTS